MDDGMNTLQSFLGSLQGRTSMWSTIRWVTWEEYSTYCMTEINTLRRFSFKTSTPTS